MIKIRNSIRMRLVVLIFLLIALVIGFCWLMNTLFLERVYMSEKKNTIYEAFRELDQAASDNSLYNGEFDGRLESGLSVEELSYLVISADGQQMISNIGSYDFMIDQLYRTMFTPGGRGQVLQRGENYSIELRSDNRSGAEYMLLWGTLSDGNTVLIRAAVENIRESARLANTILFIAGTAAIVIGFIAALIASGYFTRPIRTLTDLSKQMAGLDFDARYEPRKNPDEIDTLGVSMNELSGKLEQTIYDLKNANKELERDIRLRDENDAMRADFITNVSHELKTPLALIGGYAEGLKDAVNDDEESRKYYCDVIIDETAKMSHMVRDLLALNQMEYGKDSVDMHRFDIVPIIDGIVRSNMGLAEEAGITIKMSIGEKCDVWADELIAEQIVTNYISNAIHYCEGERIIEIALLHTDDKVRLSVHNTGQAISEESMPHIWEKFYKADKARSRSYGGSGIGLSIVKAAADSLQGECSAVNERDGVTFYFDFVAS